MRTKRWLNLLLGLCIATAEGSVVISEFMAGNSHIPYTNPLNIKTRVYGWDVNPDWIELRNTAGTSVDIGGMYLTDDKDLPAQWQFPAGTTMGPNGYLIVFASGKTVEEYPSNYPYVDEWDALHTNFELSGDGGYLALIHSDGLTVAHDLGSKYPKQRGLVSYGLSSSGTTNFLTVPTPGTLSGNQWTGAANSGAYAGVVKDTNFSIKRGFYHAAFDVFISCDTPGATIYFTTDSSEPIDSSGNPTLTAQLYDAVSNKPRITTTTCLRAAAAQSGWLRSDIDTQTYIFVEDVLDQTAPSEYATSWGGKPADYQMEDDANDLKLVAGDTGYTITEARAAITNALLAIPTLSVVADKESLFTSSNAIYLNTDQEGDLWERAVSAELFDPVDGSKFQMNCGLRLQGGSSRVPSHSPKHSLSLRFRGGYGAGKLNENLFPDSPVDNFNSLQLRAMYNNSWIHYIEDQRQRGSLIRDQWMRDTLIAMGDSSAGHGSYVHLYLNGLYWGVYNMHERQEAGHFGTHFDVDSDTLDAISGQAVADGNKNSWNALHAEADSAAANGSISLSEYQSLAAKLDMVSLCDYMIVNQFGGNSDWDNKNWRAVGGGVNQIPWRIYSWDGERIFEGITKSVLSVDRAGCPSHLFQNMRKSDEFMTLYADRIHKHYFNDGVLTPQFAVGLWTNRADQLDQAIIAESARWGDSRRDVYGSSGAELYTRNDHWIPEQNRLLNSYFSVGRGLNRSEEVLQNQYIPDYYPNVPAPIFYIDGAYQHGGYADPGDVLNMSNPGAGTMYYTLDGTDPRLPGGALNPAAIVFDAEGTGSQTIPLVEESSSVWKYLYNGSNLGTAWRQLSFSDGSWGSGSGELGFGDGDETTDIGPKVNGRISAYFRHTLNVVDPSGFTELRINLKYDDGAVVYLNGTEIDRVNMPTGSIAYNTLTLPSAVENANTDFIGIDPSMLVVGQNILAVEVHQKNTTSSDLSFNLGLDAISSANSAPSQLVLTESATIRARVLNGGTWSALNEAGYAVGPVAESVRVSEIMYNPAIPDTEYIEVENKGTSTINLSQVSFTRGIQFSFPSLELAPGEYALVVENLTAFEAAYDTTGWKIAGAYTGFLNNSGEKIELRDAAGTVIQRFGYKDSWYDITDGQGFSLTMIDTASTNLTLWDQKAGWRPSAAADGSPGLDDSGQVYPLGAIVINEVLAHSHATAPDWIELHNTTAAAINMGGWFLSDDNSGGTNNTKFAIPLDTIIPAGGYAVVYEDTSFGSTNNPGSIIAFGLSEGGDQVYLFSGDGVQISGYAEEEDFGASASGVAFGRHFKASTDSYNFVAMSANTPGAANAYPLVGPVVISQIMYNPASGGSYDNDEYEYIELSNITASPVLLEVHDDLLGMVVPWKFTKGIDYTFPLGTTVPAGGSIVVAKNLAAYAERYGSSAGVFGPYDGQLSNGGEKLDLSMPGDEEPGQERYYILVDRVNYSDGSHPEGEDPWPTAADGGYALVRLNNSLYGNDVSNWSGSPGGAPPNFTDDPIIGTTGSYGTAYSGTLAGTAVDLEGTAVSYSKAGSSGWLVVAPGGTLSGTPDQPGLQEFTVEVSDGYLTDTATLQINVLPQGSPPAFSTDPMQRADAVLNEEYSTQLQTLAGSATDSDSGATLSYSKVDGPNWLSVGSDGALAGIPVAVGANSFTVRVDDENGNSDTASLLINVSPSLGGTVFFGGLLSEAANWSNGLPSDTNQGTIPAHGFYAGHNQATVWVGSGSIITVNNGAVLELDQDFSVSDSTWIISNATVNCSDDFFAEKGHIILEAGSVVTANDDWEANNRVGRITVNGGAHSSGAGTGNNVGAQGNASKIGNGIDFRGGTVTAGNFRFQINSTSSVGGSAILESAGPATMFSDARGAINILPDWSGSWEVSSFSGSDWKALVTNTGKGFTLNGVTINTASFTANFIVSADGTTLSPANPPPVAVGKISMAYLSGGTPRISWIGVAGHSYTVEYKNDLVGETFWKIYATTNITSDETISIPLTLTDPNTFYRIIGVRN